MLAPLGKLAGPWRPLCSPEGAESCLLCPSALTVAQFLPLLAPAVGLCLSSCKRPLGTQQTRQREGNPGELAHCCPNGWCRADRRPSKGGHFLLPLKYRKRKTTLSECLLHVRHCSKQSIAPPCLSRTANYEVGAVIAQVKDVRLEYQWPCPALLL